MNYPMEIENTGGISRFDWLIRPGDHPQLRGIAAPLFQKETSVKD